MQTQKLLHTLLVLTKIVLFGGNIVFAYHTDGKKHGLEYLLKCNDGFNICTDLLLPKKDGQVIRLHRFEDPTPFWRTRFLKGSHEYRPGVKAKEWFIYSVDDLYGREIARVTELTPKYREAMDHLMYSFDLVQQMIKKRYTPDQNEHI